MIFIFTDLSSLIYDYRYRYLLTAFNVLGSAVLRIRIILIRIRIILIRIRIQVLKKFVTVPDLQHWG